MAIETVVFLDIDGVLNTFFTQERVNDSKCRGVENQYIENLKKIIDQTGAKIVLISSWKTFWEDDSSAGHMSYLKSRLAEYGLKIHDVTSDRGENRGYGILQYVGHNEVKNWVVLDDEEFDDYRAFGVMRHLVKTSYITEDGGLGADDVREAIRILKGEE